MAEFGDSYQYLYTPDTLAFNSEQTIRTVVFKFNDELAKRYQFRWITATQPQHLTLAKMSSQQVQINLDNGDIDGMYFEVWIYDSLTGKRFMCEPVIIVEKPE